MIDVLNLVPGFNITKDDDYTSFLSRGLFGFEGRTFIMLNGMQLSDLYFGSYIIGNDIPIHLIKRIEIIRGPGSVIYGGTAELAVINIITYAGNDLNGGRFNVRYGQMGKISGHSDVGFTAGKKTENFEISAMGFYGNAMRSNGEQRYIGRDFSFDQRKESAGIVSSAFTLQMKYKENTKIDLMYNHYQNFQVRKFAVDSLDPKPSSSRYSSIEEGINARKIYYKYSTIGTNVSHVFAFDKLKIVPAFNYQYSYPYERSLPREEVVTQRIKPNIYCVYTLDKFELLAGAEYFADLSKVLRPEDIEPFDLLRKNINDAGSDQIMVSNIASYVNAKILIFDKNPKIELNTGLRYDYNELFGDKLNPRIALNLVSGDFHTKLIYNSAFRAPLVANNSFSRYGINPDTLLYSRSKSGVKPEETKVFDWEIGYLITKDLYFSINSYYQVVNNIIEFRYNYKNEDIYSDNGGKIATYGIDSELKYISRKLKSSISVSWCRPRFFDYTNEWAYSYENAKGGDTYICPDNENGVATNLHLLGLSEVKIYTYHSYSINRRISLNINAMYLSEKWAYSGNATSKKLDSQYILGAGINIDRIFRAFSLNISVHDLLNERLNVATAWYDGGYDVLPYKGREISASLSYRF